MMRRERDFLGEKEVEANALYGIHSMRARENFPVQEPFAPEWYRAMGLTKLACYQTIRSFREALVQKLGALPIPLRVSEEEVLEALIRAAGEVADGEHFDHFVVPALQGGAGTSINMNVNEIIANLALRHLGHRPGEYSIVDPIEDANLFQSTNDVVPTALRVAAMQMLGGLEDAVNALRLLVEEKEGEGRAILRRGFTQMQAAVPATFGTLLAGYSEALSRDWWRVSKCLERIKQVNLGGSAIGTALGVPRYFAMEVVPTLRQVTGLPVSRSENLPDTTANLDAFVEVHGILKTHAVNLEKMVSDLRLLAADAGPGEISLPPRQAGSSIMPGKVNPVIPEFVVGVAHQVYANDQLITGLAALGCLELNAYLPSVGHALLSSIRLLTAADKSLAENVIRGLGFISERSSRNLFRSPAITTALAPLIGYHAATRLALEMKSSGQDVFEVNQRLQLLEESRLQMLLEPHNLLKLGFSLADLTGEV